MFNAVMLVTIPDSIHLHLCIVGQTNIIFECFCLYSVPNRQMTPHE